MKKVTILAIGLIFPMIMLAQTLSQECVSCDSNTVALDLGASALGTQNISTGVNSLAAGYLSEATEDYSVALGKTATANGIQSVAIGLLSEASGNASLALGPYTITHDSALLSIALGSKVTAAAERCMTVGFGLYESPIENHIKNSLMMGFNSNLPTFYVSPSDGVGTTGKIGIGNITDLTAKLHIRADDNENATLKLEAPGTNKVAKIILADDDNTITALSGGNMEFHVNNNGHFKFNNGNVGIGINSPEQKLDVNGTMKATGFQLVNNSQGFGKILQSDDQGNATWVDVPGGGCVQCSGGEASGEFASIVGENNFADGRGSFAGGLDSYALGNQSFAFGDSTIASGNYSVAMGYMSEARGMSSFAMGNNAFAGAESSFAFGFLVEATPSISFVAGKFLKATASGTIILGSGTSPNGNIKYLTNNVFGTMMIGFNSDFPTFFVSRSNGEGTTGKIGIGNVTDPQAKLHIRADENYDTASVFIQSFNDNKPAYLWMGNKNFGIHKHNTTLEFLTSGDYVFDGGNMGIGTENPQAKVQVKDGDIFIEDIDRGIIMKSPDGNCWRATATNNGTLQLTQVDCESLTVGYAEPTPGLTSGVKIYPNPAGNRVIVALDAMQEAIQLKITNINGKQLYSEKLNNPESFVDLSNFKKGMYVFSLYDQTDKLIESKKVIKE